MSPKVPFDRVLPLRDSLIANTVSSLPGVVASVAPAHPTRPADQSTSQQKNSSNRCKARQMKRMEEYRKLKAVVPSVKPLRRAKKVTIINEAVKYIDKLHADLMEKITQGKIPALSHLNQAGPLSAKQLSDTLTSLWNTCNK